MRVVILFLMIFSARSVAAVDVCGVDGTGKYFISPWVENGKKIEVLSWMEGRRVIASGGDVVSRADLNGDGLSDYIFHNYFSGGAAVNLFLIF